MENANAYALVWCFWVLATMVLASRLAVRLLCGARKLFLEDIFIIIAWFTYLALIIVLSVGISVGLAASTRGDKSLEDSWEVLKTFFLHGYFLYTTLWLVKASLVSFYARICWNSARSYRVITYITVGILGVTFIIVTLYKSFYCFPLVKQVIDGNANAKSRVWNPSDQCTGGSVAQYTRSAYLLTTSLLDIATDLICLILPFCILRNLHISLRKKIALGILFAIALLSLVCGCIRLTLGATGGTKFEVAAWAVVEATTALCVASAPALRPLFFRTSYLVRGTSNKFGGSIGGRPNARQISRPRDIRASDLSDVSDRRMDIMEFLKAGPSNTQDGDSTRKLTEREDEKVWMSESSDTAGEEVKEREEV